MRGRPRKKKGSNKAAWFTLALCAVIVLVVADKQGYIPSGLVTGSKVPPTTACDIDFEANSSILSVCFSPAGDCESIYIDFITQTQTEIDCAFFSFTSDPIGNALAEQAEAGKIVSIILEEGQLSQYSEEGKLAGAGADVLIDQNSAYMHNKFCVLPDLGLVITGSYNPTNNAETRNNENIVVLKGEDVAALYKAEFDTLWEKWD